MKKVLILGASGMLGEMLCRVLAGDRDLEIRASFQTHHSGLRCLREFPGTECRRIDLLTAPDEGLAQLLCGCDWVINAAGIIKQRMCDDLAGDVECATMINALLPDRLARLTAGTGTRILQIATDCVFSGHKARRDECAPHDALDVYGKTKSLGEVRGPNVHHLRCSIIGPDPHKMVSLLEWLLSHPLGASLLGFANHEWNGITTYHFARICRGILRGGLELPAVQHILPTGRLTKFELLKLIAKTYGRADLQINETRAPQRIDRTLATTNWNCNLLLWQGVGFTQPPTIPEMVRELAEAEPRLGYPLRKVPS